MPDFVTEYIIEYYTGESINTQIGYAIDIRVFLNYLKAEVFDNIENIKVLELGIKTEFIDVIQEEINNLFTEIHGLLGVTYNRYPKKERLINAEVQNQTEIIELFSNSLYQTRLKTVEKLQNIGAELSVELFNGGQKDGN